MLYRKLIGKFVCICCLISIFPFDGTAQTFQIRGAVIDTSAKIGIHEASVILLQAQDSILVADSRTTRDGTFGFNNIQIGSYILLITHPKYTDFVERFVIDNNSKIKSFDKIFLTQKAILLREVIIYGNKATAITFRGDTTEFDADSFKVQPNATVEELLKRLPGLQVDRNGQITALGKKIDKVLVDGEEFFSDDPTLVTRNLKANMVDKVQVYDKASNQSAFTGVSDGKTTKTLNLKLKEDKKHGIFGNVELGAGNRGFYQNQSTFNAFNGNEKFAAYFILSNTGRIGLDRRSQLSYAGNDANPISTDLNNWNGTYSGIGIPRSITGGLQYDNKWDEEKQSINANYKFNGLDVNGRRNSILQNNLPGNILYTTSNQNINDQAFRHGANVAYNIKSVTSSELKFNFEGSLLSRIAHEDNNSETRKTDRSLANNRISNFTSDGDIKAVNTNLLWQKKFTKERRSISLNFNARLNSNIASGFFYTLSNFFNTNGTINNSETVDQFKTTYNKAELYNLKGTYTEPIGKWGAAVANYGIYADNTKATLKTFNKSGANNYNVLDNLFSNSYGFNQLSNRGGLAYIFNKQKLRIQIGSDLVFNKFEQHNLTDNTILNRNFVNWFPEFQFRYNNFGKNFDFNYSGNTNQPSIQQLQPIVNNIDPLNLFIGNKDLQPSFTNNFSIGYNFYKDPMVLFFSGNISIINNPITISTQTDNSSGKSTNTFVNLSGVSALNYTASILYRDKIKKGGIDWGLDGNVSGTKYASMVNGVVNTTNAVTYQTSFVISQTQNNKYSLGIMAGPNYNVNKSSLQPDINNNSWGYIIQPFFSLFLPQQFELNTSAVYTWKGKTQTFNTNLNRFIWDAWIGKKPFKDKGLMIKLSANDILNQNVGLSRNAYNNIITQNSYSTVARYFAASLVWDFNYSGKGTK